MRGNLQIMRFIRYKKENGEPQLGWVLNNQVGLVHGDLFTQYQRGEATTPLASVQLLPPSNLERSFVLGEIMLPTPRNMVLMSQKSPYYFSNPHQPS